MPKLVKGMVDAFKCPPGKDQAFLRCTFTRGFALRCTENGVKSFVAYARVKGTGKERTITIGRYGEETVETARDKAFRILNDMRAGIDPVEVAKQAKAVQAQEVKLAVTLREVATHYVAHKTTTNGPLRPLTQKGILRQVQVNLKDWCDQPIAAITRDKCLERFREMSVKTPAQARLCFTILAALCSYAKEKYSTDDSYPLLPVNPVARMFKLNGRSTASVRTRRIPLGKVGVVWKVLMERKTNGLNPEGRTAAALVAFILLTGARRGEASALRWTQVDFDAGTVTFPAAITKTHTDLTLPMTTTMRELLTTVPRRKGSPYVWASWGPKVPYLTDPRGAVQAVAKAAGLPALALHDLRRTAEDLLLHTGCDSDLRRRILNHAAIDSHGSAYGNNPDPKIMLPALQTMHDWIEAEARKK